MVPRTSPNGSFISKSICCLVNRSVHCYAYGKQELVPMAGWVVHICMGKAYSFIRCFVRIKFVALKNFYSIVCM